MTRSVSPTAKSISISMTKRTPMPLFLIVPMLLMLVGSTIASSDRHQTLTATDTGERILNPQSASALELELELALVKEPAGSQNIDTHPSEKNRNRKRKLAVYALYDLDKFSVRFSTSRTAELELARSSAALQQQSSSSSVGAQWTLVSETGGLESSLSYPIRSATQDFLYLGFQNLIDNWMLELGGGPDGNNDLSYLNDNTATTTNNNDGGDFSNRSRLRLRLLQAAAATQSQNSEQIGQVFNTDGGDSTGEEDYNANRGNIYNNPATATQVEVEVVEVQVVEETTPEETPKDSFSSIQDQQQTESQQIPASDNLFEEEEQPQSPQPQSSPQNESEPAIESPGASQSPRYVDIYDGLVYNTMYDHLVAVDLRVELYLRKDGYSNDEDSLRKNLRLLDDTGEVELMAKMTPTIAFLEPASEEKKRNKPSNADVEQVFGVWTEYMFAKQRSVYLRTLREVPDQDLLQEITKLRVDIGTSATSPISASNSSGNFYTEAWSERTQNALIAIVVILGIFAVVWPLYAYGRQIKRDRRLSLQLMHGGLSLDGGEYDCSDSFSSVTFRDNVHDMVKLPPINQSVSAPMSLLARPDALSMIQRVSSMDTVRHGKDTFPSTARRDSTKSAMSALEASERYLSRHRPDLFADRDVPEIKATATVNVFGRVYEIPSNPFDFIYKGGQAQRQQQHQQQQQQQQQQHDNFPPANTGMDLGLAAHFPFSSPRSSFTAKPPSVGGNPYSGRSTSVGSTGSNSASHFTPIVPHNQNLATGLSEEDGDELMGPSRITAAPGIAAHTGHSWQNNDTSFSSSQYGNVHPSHSAAEVSGGNLIGNIFRNLSTSSWYSNTINASNSYTANTQVDPAFNPAASGDTEVYYDDYRHQHQEPSQFPEIELESLPQGDEDPENYNFAFQDFPRKDGTPCLIIDDDSFLSERQRRESAKMIFTINDEDDKFVTDELYLPEKNVADLPVSDDAFKMMLSQNALDIDNSIYKVDDSDDSMVLPPLEGSFLSKDPHDAKSPEFQEKLTRLMDTKRQRYTRENKNAAIVAANQKKRKNVRERERVDRHKAIERELEDIEAEFSLTMQPLSPDRSKNNNSSSSIHDRTTPNRNAHSPKPTIGGARYSPMPSRIAASPNRKNIATLSPTRSNLTNIGAHSPVRSNMQRSRGGGNHIRHNSLGGGHRTHHSLGTSPYRKFSPRTRVPNQAQNPSVVGNMDVLRQPSFSGEGVSPPGALTDFDSTMLEYKPKFRPSNFSGPKGISGGGKYDDLSLPSMAIAGEFDPQPFDAKFPSPQAVIDEVLQSGTQKSLQKPHRYPSPQPTRHQQRTMTPTRMRPSSHHQRSLSSQQIYLQRRTSSFDVDDSSFQRRAPQRQSSHSSSSSSQFPQYPMTRQPPSTVSSSNSSHRRSRSSSIGANHKRSSSRDEDIFLHGVVAQTRFI